MTQNILFLFIAYLLGSIPFGFLVAKSVKGIDIREHGSKNIGATNVFRVVGKGWGIGVFVLDALKGYIGVKLPAWLGIPVSLPFELMLAVSAILGHTYTLWLKFKGGKGVATSFGVFLAVAGQAALVLFGIFLAVFLTTRILSLASLVACLSFPIAVFFLYRTVNGFEWLLGVGLCLPLFIFYTHRANIARLLKGEEKKLF